MVHAQRRSNWRPASRVSLRYSPVEISLLRSLCRALVRSAFFWSRCGISTLEATGLTCDSGASAHVCCGRARGSWAWFKRPQVQARFDPSRHVVRYDALWEQRRRRWNAVLNERIEGRGRRLLDFVRVSVRRL